MPREPRPLPAAFPIGKAENKYAIRQWSLVCPYKLWREDMLHWSLVFLVIALIAAILGFGGLAGTAVGIAKILFFVFLVVWLVAFLAGRRGV